MTVNSTTNRVAYSGNGTANPLAVAFPFQLASDLLVIATDIASGVETTQVLVSNYTVTGTPDENGFYSNGGSVVPTAVIPSYVTWTIIRNPALTQLVQHVDNDPLPAASIDNPLDKLTMISQRLSDRLSLALTAPDGDPVASMVLPSKASRLGMVLSFDAVSGIPTVSDPSVVAAQTAAAQAIAAAALASSTVGLWARPCLAILETPPVSPATADRYLVAHTGTTGVWIGKEDNVAEWSGSAWLYTGAPQSGQMLNVQGSSYQYVLDAFGRGTVWRAQPATKVKVPIGGKCFLVGDSIGVGQASGDNTRTSFIARFTAKYGLTLENDAANGKGSNYATTQGFTHYPASNAGSHNTVYIYEAGHNDAVYGNSKTPQKVADELIAWLTHVWCASAVAANDGSVTATGSWSAGDGSLLDKSSICIGGGAHIRLTGASGDTLAGTSAAGDVLVIRCFDGDGSAGARIGSFDVDVDGISAFATYNGDNIGDSNPIDSVLITHSALVIPGLGAGTHTYTIRTTSTRACYIDTIETMLPPDRCSPVVILLPPRPNNYALVGPGTATPASFNALDLAITQAVNKFVGYPVVVVRTNDWLNPVNKNADHEHPNDAGHLDIERAMSSVVDPVTVYDDNTWTPTFTGFTVVGAYTTSREYSRVGKRVTGSVTIRPTGAGTVAFVEGTSKISMPLPVAVLGVGAMVDGTNGVGAANCLVNTDGNLFLPTLSASNDVFVVTFDYVTG